MNRQDYLDTLDTFVHDPQSVGFDENIIPVAMWLRNFMPGCDDNSPCNKSSLMIKAVMCDIVDVEINDIAKLMTLNGYALGGISPDAPEWLMQPLTNDDDNGSDDDNIIN